MSSVKMESIEFAKRHFNGSNVDYADQEYSNNNDDIEYADDVEDEDNISRAYTNE